MISQTTLSQTIFVQTNKGVQNTAPIRHKEMSALKEQICYWEKNNEVGGNLSQILTYSHNE
jgi:hypothetical protein